MKRELEDQHSGHEGEGVRGGTVLDVIKARRSVRAHTGEPVSAEMLHELVEAGRWAPSGGNRQRWSFVVVQDPLHIRKLASVSPGLLGKPAALIVICSEIGEQSGRSQELNEACSLIEVGMTAQNMMLAATDRGLGSCPVRSFNPAAVSRLLRLRPGLEPELIITLGYAAQPARTPPRRPLEEIVFWEYDGEAESRALANARL